MFNIQYFSLIVMSQNRHMLVFRVMSLSSFEDVWTKIFLGSYVILGLKIHFFAYSKVERIDVACHKYRITCFSFASL